MLTRMLPVLTFAAGQLSVYLLGSMPPLVIIAALGMTLTAVAIVHHYKLDS